MWVDKEHASSKRHRPRAKRQGWKTRFEEIERSYAGGFTKRGKKGYGGTKQEVTKQGRSLSRVKFSNESICRLLKN